MKRYFLCVDPAAAKFYEIVAEKTGTTPEKIMASVLFKFAGELAAKATKEKQNPKS